MTNLDELDSLEILVIVDNELDPLSPCNSAAVQQSGGAREISARHILTAQDPRGSNTAEFRMDNICCGAHGLSLMITGIKDGQKHTILFDTGPEEDVWERNSKRLQADISKIEVIQLSHWHRDHSGGMLRVLEMVNAARIHKEHTDTGFPQIQVDLHPGRPVYRGMRPPNGPIISLEPDPTLEEIRSRNCDVKLSDRPHTILDNMFLVSGEIPRVTEYEKGLKFGVAFDVNKGEWVQDEAMADERLLMCKLKDKGIVMFTGCSHAGVVNAAKHAMDLGEGTPLHAIVGGFHLADAQPTLIQSTMDDLRALDPKLLLAGHCTGWRAKFEMQKRFMGGFTPCFVGSKFVL